MDLHAGILPLTFILLLSRLSLTLSIPVRVGVVANMDQPRATMWLYCIQLALSDFYAAHPRHATSLHLFTRNSNSDVIGAASAALYLVKNVQVQAIIGLISSSEADFVINLGDKARVPIITSATSPSLSSIPTEYFIPAALPDSSQVEPISAIIQALGWRQVVPIYVDNEFGRGIIPFLTDALYQVNTRVPYRCLIPPSPTDDQIDFELNKLIPMQTRVFVVHMTSKIGGRLFLRANELGMMSEEYAWIVTGGVMSEFSSIETSVVESSMLGVIGVRPHVPKTKELERLTMRYKRKLRMMNDTTSLHGPSIFDLWAYDSAVALAMAVEKSMVRDATFVYKANASNDSTDLERLGVSNGGAELIKALSNTTFVGLAGEFKLNDGQLQSPPYEIVNVVGQGPRVVGYWTKETGIIRHPNFSNAKKNTHTTSVSNMGTITWPGDRSFPPKGWVVPTLSGNKLRIGVPVKHGFFEFLKVTWNSDNTTKVEGYSVDVFDEVMKALPYSVQYDYIPFATPDRKSEGNYDDLVYQVYQGKFDAAVGDIAIVANRSQYIDFTLPYTQSGVSMVVPIKDDKAREGWVFLKPLTKELWVTSFCSFVFIGILIWILEHRTNDDFRGSPWHQVGIIFWFAFSTMVFSHKERVISNLSRFVLIIWFLVVLVLTQSYTASLTSMLTVHQIQPTVTDVNELITKHKNVGYQEGSFVSGLLRSMKFDGTRLKAFKSTQEMDELFSNGGIAAAFDDIPCLKIFLSNYCSNYIMVGPTYKTDGFGFVFPIGSPLVPDVSRAILEVTENKEKMDAIEKIWFGNQNECSNSNSSFSSDSLAVESFWGLFLIVGIAAFSALLIFVIRFLHQNWDALEHELSIRSKVVELLRRFYNKDLRYHSFNNRGLPRRVVESPRVDSPSSSPNLSRSPDQTSRHAVLYLIFLLFSIKIFITGMTTAQTISIKVGVVLDMDDYDAEMTLKCISMALSNFYCTHGHYKTRLVLTVRDSKSDVVGAADAAVDVLKNGQVEAIIGPMFSGQASFLISLGSKFQVPIVTFSATSPSLRSTRSPYFIRATLDDSSQVEAIGSLVKAFGWREVVPIYVDNEFGEGIIPYLTDALEQVNAHIPYRSVISPLATDDQIRAELYKLMAMKTRVFIVHMLSPLASRLFTIAKQEGMMRKDYAWIITDGITNEISLMDRSVIESMLGVIGVRPYVPKTNELDDFMTQYRRTNNLRGHVQDLDIFGLWAHDSAIALAIAAEKANLGNTKDQESNISRNSTDAGNKLIQALSSTTFTGLAGNFNLVDGQLESPPYEIINMVGPGARAIGYWTKKKGIVKELDFTRANTDAYSTSKSILGLTIWPGDVSSPPKGWVIPTNAKTLRVGVPVKPGFTEFVRVTWNSNNSTEVEGYCIEIFDAVMASLPYGVPYEYIPFASNDQKMTGSYNDLTYQVYLGNYDAVAGDVTIIANRSNYVDFTLPYAESGVAMIAQVEDKRKNSWVFLRPLTWQLWLTIFCSFLFIGFLVWVLEHQTNKDFRHPFWYQLGIIMWFAFSTIVFAHREKVVSNVTRFVLIIWFLVVFIITHSYTASLSSMLTIQNLNPKVTDIDMLIKSKEKVGYSSRSFVYGLLKQMNIDESRLVAFNSPEELDELLSKGSRNGGIGAAFHEMPYIKMFLNKYCSKYTRVGPIYKANGFGFVFPMGSPLVSDVSRAILDVTESKKMMEIERKWLGDKHNCPDPNTPLTPINLGVRNLWGLFAITGGAGLIALIICITRFLSRKQDFIHNLQPPIWSKIMPLVKEFVKEDFSHHDHRCSCNCMRTPLLVNNQSNTSTLATDGHPTYGPQILR